jgi:hypothetical protein
MGSQKHPQPRLLLNPQAEAIRIVSPMIQFHRDQANHQKQKKIMIAIETRAFFNFQHYRLKDRTL